MTSFWNLGVEDVARALKTSAAAGLTGEEAALRLRQVGPNQLQEKEGEGPWKLFLAQFRNFIIWVLIVAALISGFLREWIDTLAIVGIVILNAILGFVQEYRAEQALAALRRLASPSCKAIRGGQLVSVPSAELVPGDLVELEAGDHVPADSRVVSHTANFGVQEASLTGESTPVTKHAHALEAAEVPLAERSNMVFMGTAVTSGKARVLVALTGM